MDRSTCLVYSSKPGASWAKCNNLLHELTNKLRARWAQCNNLILELRARWAQCNNLILELTNKLSTSWVWCSLNLICFKELFRNWITSKRRTYWEHLKLQISAKELWLRFFQVQCNTKTRAHSRCILQLAFRKRSSNTLWRTNIWFATVMQWCKPHQRQWIKQCIWFSQTTTQ